MPTIIRKARDQFLSEDQFLQEDQFIEALAPTTASPRFGQFTMEIKP